MVLLFDLLNGFIFLLCLASMGYYGYAIYAAIAFFHSNSNVDLTFLPPLTLLKPLCGLDADMDETLATCCQQDYPTYQIIFTAHTSTDPSIAVVKKLQQNFPNVDIELVISDRLIGSNLKISNLANGISKVKYDILVLADSDIKVDQNYLKEIVQPFKDDKIGVVTCLYRSKIKNLISLFEAIGISTHFHPSVLVARLVEELQYGFGSTIVIRKSILESIGGLNSVANCLADDYKLVNLVYQAGYRVRLSNYIVEHSLDTHSLRELIQRQSRWLRCIRVERFSSYLGLIITYGTCLSLIFLMVNQGSLIGWSVLGFTLTLRLFLAWLVGIYYFKDPVVKQGFWLIFLRDIFGFIMWFYGLFNNTVIWRGETFYLLKGGEMIKLNPSFAKSHSYSQLSSNQ